MLIRVQSVAPMLFKPLRSGTLIEEFNIKRKSAFARAVLALLLVLGQPLGIKHTPLIMYLSVSCFGQDTYSLRYKQIRHG